MGTTRPVCNPIATASRAKVLPYGLAQMDDADPKLTLGVYARVMLSGEQNATSAANPGGFDVASFELAVPPIRTRVFGSRSEQRRRRLSARRKSL
jgi:hypothetical protein